MLKKLSTAQALFWTILAGYLLFILTASFYDTSWSSLWKSEGNTPNRIALWMNGEITFRHLRDIVTNVLLYLPLGMLAAVLVSLRGKVRMVHPAALAGLILSVGIETMQAFVGRYSDPTDIVSNGLGHFLGFSIMAIAIQRFHLRPEYLLGLDDSGHSYADALGPSQTLRGIRFLYVALFVVVALVPLDFAVGLADILRKLQPLNDSHPRLILDLGYHLREADVPVRLLLLSTLAFAPLAMLTALIDRIDGTVSLSRPVLHCALLAAGMETAKIFIASGRSDVLIPLLAAGCGAVVGFLVNSAGARYQNLAAASRSREMTRYLILLIGLYLVFLFTLAWSPFEFESSSSWKHKLLTETNWIPFRHHFSSRSLATAIDLVRETALLVPLGALLAQLLRHIGLGLRWHWRALAGAALGLCVGGAVEASQSIVVGRYIDLTDVLLACAGSLIGCLSWYVVSPRLLTHPGLGSSR